MLNVVSRQVPKTFHRARMVLQDPETAMSGAPGTMFLGLVWSEAYERPVLRCQRKENPRRLGQGT